MIIPVRFSGEYQVQVLKADRTVRYRSHWMPNIVTNAGLDRVGSGSDFLNECHVGTGTVVPQATDSALEQHVAGTSNRKNASSGRLMEAPFGGRYQVSWEFGLGAVVGNMSEVGVGWSSGGLFSRALFVDVNGNPTTITVLSDEMLYVTYRLFNYAPQADETFTFSTPSGTRTAVVRPADLGNGGYRSGWGIQNGVEFGSRADYPTVVYDGALGDEFSTPTGVSSEASSGGSVKAYSVGSYQRDTEFYWSLTRANFAAGITAFLFRSQGLGAYQFSVDPPFMKTDADLLSMTFRTQWGRYED
ncbi:MAG: hypothetical protein VBE63_08230 [Lamprobacter sp.]|uniref:hypothetical protein n=1 Tax=Lamprobacter sp. TaxID=3100796 RepID=UPI002B264509|nr:hypothetical protein [Lamprobacter sp.]MEA3639916.1 hypothetical protein [Lamprobacter sp.]